MKLLLQIVLVIRILFIYLFKQKGNTTNLIPLLKTMKTLTYNQIVAISCTLLGLFIIGLLAYSQHIGTLNNLNNLGY